MHRAVRRLWPGAVLLGVLIGAPGAGADKPAPDAKDGGREARPGMTAAQVRELLGPPKRVAREILYARYVEQWTYDDPPVRIEFDWRKGQEKQIQTVHPLSAPGR